MQACKEHTYHIDPCRIGSMINKLLIADLKSLQTFLKHSTNILEVESENTKVRYDSMNVVLSFTSVNAKEIDTTTSN